jgi:hypothetical protein
MTKSELRQMIREVLKEELNAGSSMNEGIFDKFKKNKPEPAKVEEPKKEEPKKEEPEKKDAFETYTYDEWLQALEYGHKYYAEDGPEAGKTKLWSKAMEIAASKNLCKDVTDCMDAWMKHKGSGNFPHKTYAKHLQEAAISGGQAEGGFLDTAKRAGGAKKEWKDALEGKKTKTVKAKDLKPGMVTSTGEVKKVTDAGWINGKSSVEISYGGIGAQGSHASDCVAADKDYKVLDESLTIDNIFENLF